MLAVQPPIALGGGAMTSANMIASTRHAIFAGSASHGDAP